jgi:hypothetical protein
MIINLVKLLDFYDVYRPERAQHVSAITTFLGVDLVLGILKHYFEEKGWVCRITTSEASALGSRQRLDRWVAVNRDGRESFYQTEVKNWSVYTTGVPRTLTLGMNARQLNNYAFELYRKQWSKKLGTFTDFENLNKVLLPMVPHPDIILGETVVRPLVCYWYPITPSDRLKLTSHFFTLPCKGSIFTEVDVFSASLYLRKLTASGITSIDIHPGPRGTSFQLMQGFLQS